MPRIAARYIGHSPVILAPRPGDPYLDANGQPLQPSAMPNGQSALVLSRGDSLQVEEHELLGQTYLIDATGARDPALLGTGFCPLPQHQGKHWYELTDERFAHDGSADAPAGIYHYEFHLGRADFAPFVDHPRTFPKHPSEVTETPAESTAEPTQTKTFTLPTVITKAPAPTPDEESGE